MRSGSGRRASAENSSELTMWPRKTSRRSPSRSSNVVGARLGELARDSTDLDDGHPGAVGKGDRHLQDDLQLVADAVGRASRGRTQRSRPPATRRLAGRPPEPVALGADVSRQRRRAAASSRARAPRARGAPRQATWDSDSPGTRATRAVSTPSIPSNKRRGSG